MPWDIDSGKEGLNPPRRFDWDEEGKEWVKLVVPTDNDLREIFKRVGIKEKVFTEVDKKTRQMQRLREFAPTEDEREKFDEELWDFTIPEWHLEKPDGGTIECNRANKCLMMRNSPAFSIWINESLEAMREGVKEYAKALEKN